MKSLLDVRLGVQVPQIVRTPPDVVSLDAAEEAIALADSYGVADGHPLDESQKFTLRTAMGERADGSWAAATFGDFEPRQSGKNDALAARELYGIISGERLIIHTAHEFPTANESFLRFAALFENWDDLRKRVRRIFYGNGAQGIDFRSGQRILYKTRTGGSGRGFAKADLVVYDEAQHLKAEHVAASGPARLVNPNAQAWYLGSGGLGWSANARRLRRRALTGEGSPRFGYVEHTAERLTVAGDRIISERPPDVLDRDEWALAHPAYGHRITDESLLSLYDELGSEQFARECLCVWDPEEGDDGDLIPEWPSLADPSSSIASHHCIALDVSPDRRWSCFGAAGRREDGRLHVEAWEHRPGTKWVLEVAQASWNLRHIPIRIQSGSPAGAFIAPLQEHGVEVIEVSGSDHAQALGQLLDACANDDLRHLGGVSLNAAAKGAVVRTAGDSDVLGRRTSKVDITPLVAVTLALGGVPSAGGGMTFAF
jgi:hypothetical protein